MRSLPRSCYEGIFSHVKLRRPITATEICITEVILTKHVRHRLDSCICKQHWHGSQIRSRHRPEAHVTSKNQESHYSRVNIPNAGIPESLKMLTLGAHLWRFLSILLTLCGDCVKVNLGGAVVAGPALMKWLLLSMLQKSRVRPSWRCAQC